MEDSEDEPTDGGDPLRLMEHSEDEPTDGGYHAKGEV